MSRDVEVRRLPERAVRRQGLLLEHVQCSRRQLATGQRLDDRGFVDQRAAGDVHENRTAAHRRERLAVHQLERLGSGGRGDHDRVAFGEHRVQLVGSEESFGQLRGLA